MFMKKLLKSRPFYLLFSLVLTLLISGVSFASDDNVASSSNGGSTSASSVSTSSSSDEVMVSAVSENSNAGTTKFNIAFSDEAQILILVREKLTLMEINKYFEDVNQGKIKLTKKEIADNKRIKVLADKSLSRTLNKNEKSELLTLMHGVYINYQLRNTKFNIAFNEEAYIQIFLKANLTPKEINKYFEEVNQGKITLTGKEIADSKRIKVLADKSLSSTLNENENSELLTLMKRASANYKLYNNCKNYNYNNYNNHYNYYREYDLIEYLTFLKALSSYTINVNKIIMAKINALDAANGIGTKEMVDTQSQESDLKSLIFISKSKYEEFIKMVHDQVRKVRLQQ